MRITEGAFTQNTLYQAGDSPQRWRWPETASPRHEGDVESKGGTRGVGGEVVPGIIGSTPKQTGSLQLPSSRQVQRGWQGGRNRGCLSRGRRFHPMRRHMEAVVDRHGEPCQRRTAVAMQGAVRKEVWPARVAETGRDQATDQQEVKTHRFPLASGWGRWAVRENGCLE